MVTIEKMQSISEKLIKNCERLEEESCKLSEKAVKHLANGNEMEWEDCLTRSVEKESYARGIRDTLKKLGLQKDYV